MICSGVASSGHVLLVELDGVQAEVLDALQGLLGVEVAEGVALDAEGEAAERVVLLLSRRRRRAGTAARPRAAPAVRKEVAAGRVRAWCDLLCEGNREDGVLLG